MKKVFLTVILTIAVTCMAACAGKSDDMDGQEAVNTVTDNNRLTDVAEPEATATPEPTATPTPTMTPDEMIGDLSLREMFAEHGIKVGTCLSQQMLNDAQLVKILKSQFNSFTMENSMKPDYIFDKAASIETGELVVKLPSDAIKMLDWAKKNNMAVRGHTLVWYSQTPDWIFHEDFDTTKPLVTREVMLGRLESEIRNMFATLEELGYSELFYAYDVVNEYWMENGTMRANRWTETIGEDYVKYALIYTRQYAPENIELYINDYNEQFKHTSVVKYWKTLVDEDGTFLMDGIGYQAHLYTSDSLDTYFKAVDTVAELGLKLEITELDVELGSYQKPLALTDDNLKKQGRFFYNLVNGLLERVDAGTLQMDSFTVWGITDKLSWRKEYNPLLFDRKYQPKYGFFGVMQEKDRAGFAD